MPFHLQTNEYLGPGMRRIFCEQIDSAIETSSAGSNGSTSRQVHDVRKHLKKMRAVLRLLRDEMGARRFKAENRCLRDAGRQLSAVRDAEVRVRTLDKLCDTAAERETLLAIIDARRPRLRHATLDLSRQFFSEGPTAFAKRVTGYFQDRR